MSNEKIIGPPNYDEAKFSWKEYKKEVEVWAMLTNLPKKKQGPALWMSLSGKAKEAIQDMDIDEIKADDGLHTMMAKLDSLFKVDDNQEAYLAYRTFETFLRPVDMKMQEFVIRFESLNSKIKKHQMTLPDGVLAYRFLHSANLKEDEMKLCRATIADFTYNDMKQKVLSLHGDRVNNPSEDAREIKEEPVFYGNNDRNNRGTQYNRGRYNNSNRRGSHDDGIGRNKDYNNRSNDGGNQSYRGRSNDSSRQRGAGSWRGRDSRAPQSQQNPLGRDGKPKACGTCSSTYHFARNCPESGTVRRGDNAVNLAQNEDVTEDTSEENPSNLVNLSFYESDKLRRFVGETLGCGVVDPGCSKTVTGKLWMDCYLDMLDDSDIKKVTRKSSNEFFTFGKGPSTASLGKVSFPAVIGKKNVMIETDVVDADIPLLLSKAALKKAKSKFDFDNDSAIIFGEEIRLISTKSGHYAIALNAMKNGDEQYHLSLMSTNGNKMINEDAKKVAEKLHRQFGHCTAERLNKLIKDSKLWEHEKETKVIESVFSISKNCLPCQRFKKTPPVPIVSLPLSSTFNEAVSMDLIVIKQGKYILHIIDMFTRYSAACVRQSKRQEVIVDAIMKIWISYFGQPGKFLADNGGEFSNQEYKDMCEVYNIEMMKTGAESPWSNGLCERHNGVLKESILKTMEDSKCSLETATAWAVSAKNSLMGHNGYSPNTLVFGKNPNFPSVIRDKVPALTAENLCDTVQKNLSAMKSARENFIKSESSERIKRALSHNIRSAVEQHFSNGEKVFYKRQESRRWNGPGKVIGQDGKQVLVKNGGDMVRVHVSRLMKVLPTIEENESEESMPETKNNTNGETVEQNETNLEDIENGETMSNVFNIKTKENALEEVKSKEVSSVKDQKQNSCDMTFPSVNMNILYKLKEDGEWQKGIVNNKAGNMGKGRKGNWRRIVNDNSDKAQWINFNTDVLEWEPIASDVLISTNDKNSILEAKLKELDNWKINNVFKEVVYENQHLISTRWVLTTKEKEGVFITKARLVARGFEDEVSDRKTDSPTCSKETVKLVLAVMAMKGWKCSSLDVRTAFLQGNPLERDIYVKPPKEAKTQNVWKLCKAVYGLKEASRYWYNRIKDELINAGFQCSKYDEALFYCKKNQSELQGINSIHVDDLLFGGTKHFHGTKISKIRSTFEIGSEDSTPMKYLGNNIDQDEGAIYFSQEEYIKDVNPADLELNNDKNRTLTDGEQRNYRAICGQLNWIASQSRPDLAFDVCQLSTKLNKATVRELIHANKVLRKAKEKVVLKFMRLKAPVHLLTYCDASYGNLPDGSSQGGYIIFLADERGYISPLCWSSRKLRRVCRSTVAAETMAMLDGIDASIWLSHIISEISDFKVGSVKIKTDNMSLCESVHSTTANEEKRLRVEIASIRESIRRKEVEVEWVENQRQLADVLTKQGADSSKLMRALHNGHL